MCVHYVCVGVDGCVSVCVCVLSVEVRGWVRGWVGEGEGEGEGERERLLNIFLITRNKDRSVFIYLLNVFIALQLKKSLRPYPILSVLGTK